MVKKFSLDRIFRFFFFHFFLQLHRILLIIEKKSYHQTPHKKFHITKKSDQKTPFTMVKKFSLDRIFRFWLGLTVLFFLKRQNGPIRLIHSRIRVKKWDFVVDSRRNQPDWPNFRVLKMYKGAWGP
jgi:hypothetical protein